MYITASVHICTSSSSLSITVCNGISQNTNKQLQCMHASKLTDNLILREGFDNRSCSRKLNTVDWDLLISALRVALLPTKTLSEVASN